MKRLTTRISFLSCLFAATIAWSQENEMITIDLDLPHGAKPLEMILVKADHFMMGSEIDERGRYEGEWLAHEVAITKDFYLGRYELTQAQWQAVTGSNPSTFNSDLNSPVETVGYAQILQFIERLNSRGFGKFRLPTEAEWELAARAGTTTRFSFGDALECDDEAGTFCVVLDEYAWWKGNNTHNGNSAGTKPVGLKNPNPWGFYDIHGNVDEWCRDWWEDPFPRDAQVDPQGPPNGSAKVVRSGWYDLDTRYCRVADRFYGDPNLPSDHIGFRLLLEVRDTSNAKNWMLMK